MTKREAIALFNSDHRPNIESLFPNDLPALREAWGIFIDALLRAGFITDKQYESWDSPF